MDSLHRNQNHTKKTTKCQSCPPRQSLHLGDTFTSSIENTSSSVTPLATKRHFWRTLFIFFILLVFISGTGSIIFLFSKIAHVSHTLSFENATGQSLFSELSDMATSLFSSPVPLQQMESGRINILLLGRAGEHYPGKNLTDTIMLASIDTKMHRVALLSFPRDLYAPIGTSEHYTKINAIYQIGLNNQEGINLLRETIETISGLPIHYSLIVDFDGFEKVVDTLGGISLDVPRDLYDTRYPGKNYSYETFEIKKGWQKLDGATALKYVRERHDDPEGDFGRAKRQQQVMQAVRDKVFSTGTFLNIFTLSRLIDTLGESIKTDISPQEMESFLSLIRTLDTKNITTMVIDAWKPESLLRVSHIPTPSGNAFILVPRTGNWKEISQLATTIFTLDSLKQEKDRVTHENTSVHITATADQMELASALRQLLIHELGFVAVSLETTYLENTQERSTIQDTTNGNKPYSYNALLSRFDFDQTASTHTETTSTDFLIHIGTDLENSNLLEGIGAPPEEINTDVLTPTKPTRKNGKK